jgi:hypothetical protein
MQHLVKTRQRHKLQYAIRKSIPKAGPREINSVYLQNYGHAVFIYKQNQSSTHFVDNTITR